MTKGYDSLFLPQRRFYSWLLIALMFVAAFGVRLFHMDAPGFTPLRQAYSLVIARAMYYEGSDSIPEWKKQLTDQQRRGLGEREPQIMERLAATAYRLSGAEHLWIPRLFSILWWMIGGVFLYLLASRMASLDAAVLGTAVYLFLPFGTVASRAFQPEPLMVMTLIISLFAIYRYFEDDTPARLILAAVVSSLSIFVKAPAVFPIFGAYFALLVWKHGARRSIINPSSVAFALITLALPLLHYGNDLIIGTSGGFAGYARSHILRPDLLLQPTFWAGWLAMIHLVFGFTLFIASLLGVLLFNKGRPRAMLLGSWAGYFVFGLVVPYQTSTHDYYHLLLLPVVALSVAPVYVFLLSSFQGLLANRHARLCLVMFCVALGMAASGVRIMQYSYDRLARLQLNEREIAREIGEIVNHSTNTIFLALSSGLPLQYYGELGGVEIPTTNPAIETYIDEGERACCDYRDVFDPADGEPSADYFIVTELLEFRRRPGFKEFCDRSFQLKAQAADYLVYDLRQSGLSMAPRQQSRFPGGSPDRPEATPLY